VGMANIETGIEVGTADFIQDAEQDARSLLQHVLEMNVYVLRDLFHEGIPELY